MADIILKNINKVYGQDESKLHVLKSINLSISSGEMVCIMGPSGSGKSTLLNIIGCLDKANSGEYFVNGRNAQGLVNKELAKLRNKTFGFVVQYFGLLDDYTVYENIRIPLEYAKIPRKKQKLLVDDIMDKLKIKDKYNKTPVSLSGGQNQRVAIARALVNNPDIILADEPTGALDRKMSDEVMELLLELNNEGKTIIVVTHDEKVAKKCRRVVLLEDGMLKYDVNNVAI